MGDRVMSDKKARAKIEIRLEFRQLVLLSLGTMAFSGSLFALGYFLGTRDGLQSVKSPPMVVSQEAAPVEPAPRQRAKPTRAALGEVEFLFPDQKPRAIKRSTRSVKKRDTDEVKRAAIVKTRTARRGIPRLKPRRTKKSMEESVALPTLPDVPTSLRTVSAKSTETKVAVSKTDNKPSDERIPRLSVSTKKKTVVAVKSEKIAVKPAAEPTKTAASPVKRVVVKAPAKVAAPKKTVVAKRVVVAKKKVKAPVAKKPVAKKVVRSTKKTVAKPAASRKSTAKPVVKLAHLKPVPAHDLSTHGAHYFTVQVKAVTDRGAAESVSNRLRAKGFEPNVVLADIPKKGRYYRIRVGKFRSLEAARKFQKVLSARGASAERGIVTRY